MTQPIKNILPVTLRMCKEQVKLREQQENNNTWTRPKEMKWETLK